MLKAALIVGKRLFAYVPADAFDLAQFLLLEPLLLLKLALFCTLRRLDARLEPLDLGGVVLLHQQVGAVLRRRHVPVKHGAIPLRLMACVKGKPLDGQFLLRGIGIDHKQRPVAQEQRAVLRGQSERHGHEIGNGFAVGIEAPAGMEGSMYGEEVGGLAVEAGGGEALVHVAIGHLGTAFGNGGAGEGQLVQKLRQVRFIAGNGRRILRHQRIILLPEPAEQCSLEAVNAKPVAKGRDARPQRRFAHALVPFDQKIQQFHIGGGHVLRCQPQLDECVLAVAQGELGDVPHHGGDLVTVHHRFTEKRPAGFGTVPEQRGAVERGIVALFKGSPGIVPCGQFEDVNFVRL